MYWKNLFDLINTCFYYRPNLPALKDEMKIGGLITGF
jgi:hypothetical protein